jgi:hypothetical protein
VRAVQLIQAADPGEIRLQNRDMASRAGFANVELN